MADWTAITGIIVSGVVGPGLGAAYATRRLQREHALARVLEDRRHTRELLDGAAQALKRGGRLREAINGAFMTHGVHTRERAKQHYEEFRAAGRDVDLYTTRLELRLGPRSDVAAAYRRGFVALSNAVNAIGLAADLGDHADLRDTWESLKTSGDEFDSAHEAFMLAAQELAAVELDAAGGWSIRRGVRVSRERGQ